jgi:glycosyltransferase involved in cell wall biosynthesis
MEKGNKLLTVVIITKNEENNIKECIQSISFADEVIVVDSESTDNTVEIAKKEGAKIIINQFKNFAKQREVGLKQAEGAWTLYIDADELISKELSNEIQKAIVSVEYDAYEIPRKNYYFHKYEWPTTEYMMRLFRTPYLSGWFGEVHESPKLLTKKIGKLSNFLIHYTHNDLESMTTKTNTWSKIESDQLLHANHPPMKEWRFIRVMFTKFFNSYIRQKGWNLGVPGFIESMFQAYSYFIIYSKLWELQKKTGKKID